LRMHLMMKYVPSMDEAQQRTVFVPVCILNEVLMVEILLPPQGGFIDESTKVQFSTDPTTSSGSPYSQLPLSSINSSKNIHKESDIFNHIGGYTHLHRELTHKMNPTLLKHMPVPLSFILHGAEGTGKTLYSNILTEYYENKHFVTCHKLDGSEIWSRMMKRIEEDDTASMQDWSEEIDESFLEQFTRKAIEDAPSIVVVDDFEIIAPIEAENASLDQIHMLAAVRHMLDTIYNCGRSVVFLGITRNIDKLDSSMRISNRLSFECYISIPDREDRREILQIFFGSQSMVHQQGGAEILKGHLDRLVDLTTGYVGRDIEKMIRMASFHALSRDEAGTTHHQEPPKLVWDDVLYALSCVPPSQIADVSSSSSKIPHVHWTDVAGYDGVKKRCRDALFGYMEHPEVYNRLGMSGCSGILLFGPSGCGKTLLSQALASEGKMNFFSIKCPELFSKYYGETEATIRTLFRRARQLEPCVLLFDEIDSIAQKRSTDMETQTDGGTARKALVQLLTEMDGIQTRGQLIIVGCTNRRDDIDEALLRPGRMDLQIEVPLPDETDRKMILRRYARRAADDVDFGHLARKTEGLSSADLAALCREAGLRAIRRCQQKEAPFPGGDITDSRGTQHQIDLHVAMADYLYALSTRNNIVEG